MSADDITASQLTGFYLECPVCHTRSPQADQTPTFISERTIQNSSYICVCVCVCCLLYTSPSPRDVHKSRMPSSA